MLNRLTVLICFCSCLQMQQSPGRQHHQDFPRTPSSQTPKHPGMLDESNFSGLAGQNPGHDTFEQGHMTPGTPQMDKTTTNEMAALAVASLDTPMSMLPQLGDSEEKLRQVSQVFPGRERSMNQRHFVS